MFRKLCLLLLSLWLVPQCLWAATEANPDFFQSIGKIYVVVTVIALIFIGLAGFLYRMDQRITNLEKTSLNE